MAWQNIFHAASPFYTLQQVDVGLYNFKRFTVTGKVYTHCRKDRNINFKRINEKGPTLADDV